MRFIVKQKILSLADSFVIHDENNNPYYKVVGRLFSLGDQLIMYNMNNQEQIYIKQKLFKFLPEYHLFQDSRCVAVVKKEFTFFKPRFNIVSDYGKYTVDGDFFGYNFSILKNGNRVASVSKAFFSFRDTYSINIISKQEEALLLAICIVIDQALHDKNHNNN